MSWVNLDDVYVNKAGDSIAGNLSVGGALTINDAKGSGGTYNVANEITTLRDSVSHVVRNVTFSANKQYGPFYYDEFDTEIKARNFVLAFPLSGVRFIRQAAPPSAEKQRWMIVQTYKGDVETIPVMFCCF